MEQELDLQEETRRLFIGKNVEYYLRFYKKYKESGKKISWNWCSFLLSPMWFFARKMYLFGSIFAFISAVFSMGATLILENISNQNLNSIILPFVLLYFMFNFAVGMFGNYLYMNHMEEKIIYPGEKGLSREQILKLNLFHGGISTQGIILGYLVTLIMIYLVEGLTIIG